MKSSLQKEQAIGYASYALSSRNNSAVQTQPKRFSGLQLVEGQSNLCLPVQEQKSNTWNLEIKITNSKIH
ncbi:hypothetical protein [Chlamydiifrater volucris]|uniref:hypothetical protein n=1 Tax=Chlamydiifrater volucris TaxID=2681470 RepID=UPI001BCB7963|nr:hypothetical protein [Chlamydiifrater volucris]